MHTQRASNECMCIHVPCIYHVYYTYITDQTSPLCTYTINRYIYTYMHYVYVYTYIMDQTSPSCVCTINICIHIHRPCSYRQKERQKERERERERERETERERERERER